MKPKHLAFYCRCSAEWAISKKKKLYEGYRKTFSKVIELVQMQIKKNIPITTYYLFPSSVQAPDDYGIMIDELEKFVTELDKNQILHKNKIKVSVLGKWYNLPSRIIEPIKKLIDDTKDYDSFFVNFCINYDGQEEIVDAAKMIARRVKLGKIDVDSITKENIKEDLYSSYFIPPDVIFISGKKHSLGGFLLWDSLNSKIVFTGKEFPDLSVSQIIKELK